MITHQDEDVRSQTHPNPSPLPLFKGRDRSTPAPSHFHMWPDIFHSSSLLSSNTGAAWKIKSFHLWKPHLGRSKGSWHVGRAWHTSQLALLSFQRAKNEVILKQWSPTNPVFWSVHWSVMNSLWFFWRSLHSNTGVAASSRNQFGTLYHLHSII